MRVLAPLLEFNQGQYAKAEPPLRAGAGDWGEAQGEALGPQHPDVASCLENYAVLLRNMDRPEEATRLDGRLLASGATDRICIWDLRSSNCIRVIDAGTSVIAVAFSPDRYFLASVEGNAVKLWEIASGKLHMCRAVLKS